MRSPAPTSSVLASAAPSSRNCSTVPANFSVLASIRPWKSLIVEQVDRDRVCRPSRRPDQQLCRDQTQH